MKIIHTVTCLLGLLLAGCAGLPSGPNGRLVIVGGGLQAENSEVFAAFFGKSGQRIVVIPTASGVPEESGPGTVDDLAVHSSAGQVIEVVPIRSSIT